MNPTPLLILAVALSTWPTIAVAQNNSTLASGSPNLTLEPYVFESVRGDKTEAELGRLRVAENRRNPQSQRIEIAFVRFKSKAKQPGPPLIYLEGGPGRTGWLRHSCR